MAAKAEEVTGLVLAGGRGERVGGVDKGCVLYRGRPMIEWVVERFAPQVGRLLISANRNLERYSALAQVITDADAGAVADAYPGPLAGVLAGLISARTEWIAIVPCDAPHLPADLVPRFARAVVAADAACARVDGELQPVFALVRRSTLASLQSYFASGGRAMHGWLKSLSAVAVDFDEVAAFRNINSAEDAEDRPG
jgi:molybdopterin-guanine dinucleotide biosynthesis protein A